MIAHLFNAPIGDDETAVGVGTVGSSEAIMLAGLAFKRKWQNKMKEAGKPYDKPNIVTGANVQVHTTMLFDLQCCRSRKNMITSSAMSRTRQRMLIDSSRTGMQCRCAGRNSPGTSRWSSRR